MTYEQKIASLSRYKKQKSMIVAMRADLDYWESFTTVFNSDDTGGGGGTHNNETSPTEKAATNAARIRDRIERNIAKILMERERLVELFDGLPDVDKSAMYLVYISGFPVKYAASVLDMTPNAVSKRIRAIVDKLDM